MRNVFQILSSAAGAMVLCCVSAWPAQPSAPVASRAELRGYGKVSARFVPGRAEFTCESPGKAGVLQGKLLADLLWDATEDQRVGKEVAVNGIKMTIHEFPPYGAIVVGRLDRVVVALGGSDAKEVAGLAAKERMFRDPRRRFRADKKYPIYLDFFDLGAVKIYTYAMTSNRGEGLSSHWPFIRKIGLNGIAYNLGGGFVSAKSPAAGILNFVGTDFEDREAQRNHGMIVPAISTGGALPTWALNLFPQSILGLSPTGIGEDDNTLRLFESYGMPRKEREITGLWSLRETMRRYLASPSVGGWQVFDGPAGIEIGHAYQQYADFSPSGLKSFREYLRDVRKLDLKAVGLRYYNDPGHFKSWNEVMPMDANAFFGNLDDSCLLLSDWQWQLADSAAAEPPSGSDSKWRNIKYPGSDQMHTIPEADAFYRISFDATQWLAKNPGQSIYLITGRTRAKKPNQMKVWLNGKYLGEQGQWRSQSRSAAVKVDGVLKPGSNELKLWIPQGKLLSPFFLTTHKAEEYPSSDKTLNARWVDLKDWHFDVVGARHRDAFELARGIDPDRSFILPAGGSWEFAADMTDIAIGMGSSLQNTGREAFYQPWWARLGRVAGFYGSSEPSATTTADISKPASLNRLFGWILIDGDASHMLYWVLEDYIRIERETGWFTKNKRLLSLVGKSLPQAPEIVSFRSSQTMRYSPEHYDSAPWRWDLGRGELNDAHYNWGYASERELRRGLPKSCKVVFDAGSEVMEQATVDAIATFVSGGGTFVALHNTGRHTPIEANSWPIWRLTGCRFVGDKASGTMRFESGLSVFRGSDGRELKAGGIALDPVRPDVKILARWEDGSAAVTSRTLGKGQVICLGSTFWRNARDVSREGKLAMLGRLFTDLGVERTSDASSPDIWVSDSVTKNGLENWLTAFNTALDSKTVDLKFRAETKPTEVRELISGTVTPFRYSDGWIHLNGVQFDNTQTKVFAIKRANMADGLPFWWAEKTTYWKKPAVPAVKDEPRDAGKLGTLKIERWKFLPDRDGRVSRQSDWTSSRFRDDSWGTIETGPWNSLSDELKDYTGIGLYRTTFTVPAAWKGSSISLNLFGERASPPVYGDPEFFLNGKKLEGALFQQDLKVFGNAARIVIDDYLAGESNVLAVKIKGGSKLAGEDFNGFGGSVYLAAEKPMRPALDLGGQWTLIRQDGSSSGVPLPVSKVAGKFLARDFEIPAAWAGHRVYLRLETETAWLTGAMVNGKLLLSAPFRRLGRYVEWNVTPWVKAGKSARVELWGDTLPLYRGYDPKKPPADIRMDLLSARIGCE